MFVPRGALDVPGFSVTAGVPSSIVVLEPTFDAKWTVDRSSDLAVAWSSDGTKSGVVEVAVFGDGDSITCNAPMDDGTLTVPSELLIELAPTDVGFFFINPVGSQTVSLEDGDVELVITGEKESAPANTIAIL
jgi:hypothetical protein